MHWQAGGLVGISSAIETITDRAARLAALARADGWQELRAEAQRKKEKQIRVLSTSLLSGKSVDQREIDKIVYFWKGVDWILANPEQAEDSIEKALRKSLALEELKGSEE